MTTKKLIVLRQDKPNIDKVLGEVIVGKGYATEILLTAVC